MARMNKDELALRVTWGISKVELYKITQDEVNAILNGNTSGFSEYDINVVNNIYNCWLKCVKGDYRNSLEGYLALNRDVMENVWEDAIEREAVGKLRYYDVAISGTEWKPPLFNLKQDFNMLISSSLVGEDYIGLLLNLMRYHFLPNGNKRTSLLFVNMLLYRNRVGYLVLFGRENVLYFMQRLVAFYGSGYDSELREYIERCLVCKMERG